MSFIPEKVYIVSHTHWDREWYSTYHTFRVNMCDVFRKVFDALESDPSFKHFLLDGQAVIVEDYLEIYPQDRERIMKLVSEGKLALGPWYILPDEFLISAESHARNLLYGNKVASSLGKTSKAGYMPDSFGHIAQIPQILNLGGIESFVYSRGDGNELDDHGYEFIWKAPDGSSVIALNQHGGYCSGGGLGFEELWHTMTQRELKIERAVEKVKNLFEKMAQRSNGNIVLLNNGCDHLPPQKQLGEIIEALKKEFPNTEFIHTSLEEYAKALKKAGFAKKEFCGEKIFGKIHPIISGVWSTRMYLKQKNDDAQRLLTNYWEPISAYNHFMVGGEYPSGLLEYSWKLLLKNHPHDSICGSSINDVHREMLHRFDGVTQTANQSIINQLKSFTPTFGTVPEKDSETTLCVINPLPFATRDVIDRIVVHQPFGFDPEELHLIDEKDNEIPFEIIDKVYVRRFWENDYRTMLTFTKQILSFNYVITLEKDRVVKPESEKLKTDCYFWIRFTADLPPLSHSIYRLTKKSSGNKAQSSSDKLTHGNDWIENKYVRIDVRGNGCFDLTDKLTGTKYHKLNVLEDTEDVGDEYDYSQCENSKSIFSDKLECSFDVREFTEKRGTLEINLELPLPQSISEDRKSRAKEAVKCPVSIRLTLCEDSPVVDIDVIFGNYVADHRLRALLPFEIKTDKVISDGHYYTNERPINKPSGDDWFQPSTPTYPQQDFTILQDDKGGIALLNQGLPEFEPYIDKKGNTGIALTLLRCVGWLSRDDFPTRKNMNAGPMISTDLAQCPGIQRFRYAVVPFSGSWIDAGIKQISQQWRTPPFVIQGVEDNSIPSAGSLLETSTNQTCITAIKKHDDRDTLIVRLYNLTGKKVTESLKFGKPVKRAWIVNMLEEVLSEIKLDSGKGNSNTVKVDLRGYEIVTIEVSF